MRNNKRLIIYTFISVVFMSKTKSFLPVTVLIIIIIIF